MKKLIFVLLCFVLCGCSAGVSEDEYQKVLQEANEYKEMYENLLKNTGSSLEPTPTLKITEKPTSTPEQKKESNYTFEEFEKEMYVKANSFIRDLPNDKGECIGYLYAGDKVLVIGKCKETGWYLIKYGTNKSFVDNRYLMENKPTETPIPTATPIPTLRPTKTPTPSPSPTPTPISYSNKGSYSTDLTYENLARYPDKYKFDRVCFEGKITQIIEANFLGEVTMRMNVDGDSDKNLYVVFDEDLLDFNLLVGDEITIYAEFKGLYSYTTVLGSSLSVPKVEAHIIELEEKEPEVVPTADDIEIVKEYTMSNSWYTYHFMVIKNNGNATVEVSTSTIAYSSDGSVIGLEETNVEALGSGCETVIYENFDYNKNINYFETEFSVSKDEYYDSVIQNLTYEKIPVDKGAIFKVRNNGDYEAESVKGYALFFKDGNLVDYDYSYFTDDDFEIKKGESISKQLETYEEFDSIEFYLQGRHNDW